MPLGLGGCESFLRSARASLGKVRSWRVVPKVKVFDPNFFTGPVHYRSGLLGGGDRGGVGARRAVRRLVSKFGGEGSWEASGKLDFLECVRAAWVWPA